MSDGKEALNYSNFRFDLVSCDVLQCIMALLVELRQEDEDDTGKSMDQGTFVAKLCSTEIVPVYMKA